MKLQECIHVISNHTFSLSGLYLKEATSQNSTSVAGHPDTVPILFSDFGSGFPKEWRRRGVSFQAALPRSRPPHSALQRGPQSCKGATAKPISNEILTLYFQM